MLKESAQKFEALTKLIQNQLELVKYWVFIYSEGLKRPN
jgi:hypothetical protein